MSVSIPNIFKDIVSSLDVNKHVNFKCDTYGKIMQSLETDKKVIDKKNNIYPLVILIHDFEEKYNNESKDFDIDNLNFLICNLSNPNWYAEQRYKNNIDTILNPIYEALISGIASSSYFINNGLISHKKKIDLNTGTNEGKAAYYLPDFLDGIWVKDLSLRAKYQDCSQLNGKSQNGIKIYK
jgi:hypothetical protein